MHDKKAQDISSPLEPGRSGESCPAGATCVWEQPTPLPCPSKAPPLQTACHVPSGENTALWMIYAGIWWSQVILGQATPDKMAHQKKAETRFRS